MCWNLFKLLPPTKAVCEGHVAPIDVVWSIYSQEKSNYVVVGSRGSGKTTCVALLQVLFSLTYPEIEVCNTAAALHQARRCYEAVKDFLFHPKGELGKKIIPPYVDEKWSTMWQTKVATGSSIFITSLTEKGTNAPHPQKLFIDEVDLVENRRPVEEALSMPQSKGEATRQIVFLSSWKRKGGLVSYLLDNYSQDPDSMVAFWCVFEAMQPIPDHSMCEQVIRRLADGTEISFAQVCKGRSHKSRGFLNYRDVLRAFMDMEEHYFKSQWLSEEPLGGLNVFYISQKSLLNRWDPAKYRGCPIYAGVDYGWSAPSTVILAQVVPKVGVIVFEEHALIGMSTSQLAQYCHENIEKRLQQRGLHVSVWVVDPRAHHLLMDDFSKRYLITVAPFPEKGIYTPGKHEKLSRVTIVNNMLTVDPETGLPRLFFVAERARTLLKQMNDLSYAVDSEGNPTDKIPDGNDDFVDALLYLCTYLDKIGLGEVLADVVDPEKVGETALKEVREQLGEGTTFDEIFGSPEEVTNENEQRELLRELIRERIKSVLAAAVRSGTVNPQYTPDMEEELVKRTENIISSEMTSKEATERLVNEDIPPELEKKLIEETVRVLDRMSISVVPTPWEAVLSEISLYDMLLGYYLGEDLGSPFGRGGTGFNPFGW